VLATLYGPGLNASFTHSPALIGGVRIRVGSDVYDGSVRGKAGRAGGPLLIGTTHGDENHHADPAPGNRGGITQAKGERPPVQNVGVVCEVGDGRRPGSRALTT